MMAKKLMLNKQTAFNQSGDLNLVIILIILLYIFNKLIYLFLFLFRIMICAMKELMVLSQLKKL